MRKLAPEWRDSNLLEAVFDQLSDALIIYDRDRIITGVNKAAEKMFSMAADEMVGRECGQVFRCSVCESGCGFQVGLNQLTGTPNGTVRLHTDNGRERMAVISTAPLYEDGHVGGAVVTVKDITEEMDPRKREIIAESQSMRDVLNFVRRVASSEASTRDSWFSL